jgi:hypothetical protein
MSPLHSAAVERYAAGAGALHDALQGLTAADWQAKPVPGTWSIQQIVVHLWDSDMVAADRMKRVIAEEIPLLVNYDENRAVERLDYDAIDPHQAAELFRLQREYLAAILRRQPDDAFARFGIHTQAGKKTLLDLVTGYAEHLDGHLMHLRKKRGLLGK